MAETTEQMTGGMDLTISELYRLFRAMNAKLFAGALPEPQITVQAAKSRSAYGWCTTRKVWIGEKLDPGDTTPEAVARVAARYEINLCAEFLNRGALPAAETLLHELCHLHNLEAGIRDVSGFQYHNERFKDAAEAHGLICKKVERFGWALTDLQPDTALWLMTLDLKPEAFALARALERPLTPPGSPPPAGTGAGGKRESDGTAGRMKRWACRCTNVRCAVDLAATCSRCGTPFILGAKAKGN